MALIAVLTNEKALVHLERAYPIHVSTALAREQLAERVTWAVHDAERQAELGAGETHPELAPTL